MLNTIDNPINTPSRKLKIFVEGRNLLIKMATVKEIIPICNAKFLFIRNL